MGKTKDQNQKKKNIKTNNIPMYHDCFCKKRLNAPLCDPNTRELRFHLDWHSSFAKNKPYGVRCCRRRCRRYRRLLFVQANRIPSSRIYYSSSEQLYRMAPHNHIATNIVNLCKIHRHQTYTI